MIDCSTIARRGPHVVREDVEADGAASAVAVLDMLCEAMRTLSLGRSADPIVCRSLGRALSSDAAVTVAIAPGVPPYVAVTDPDTEHVRRVADDLLTRDLRAGHEQFCVEYVEGIGHVASLWMQTSDELPSAGHGRVLVFTRRTPFGPADRLLMDRARDALVALWPHAARSVRAQRAQDWVREKVDDSSMTDRELQVLGLLAEGLLATSIASRLRLSPRTVHKHLGNIYRKLGVHDRLVAVSLARLQGLVNNYPRRVVSPAREQAG